MKVNRISRYNLQSYSRIRGPSGWGTANMAANASLVFCEPKSMGHESKYRVAVGELKLNYNNGK